MIERNRNNGKMRKRKIERREKEVNKTKKVFAIFENLTMTGE